MSEQQTGSAKKKFGFWSIVLLGFNGIVGSGIFLLPGKAFALFGPATIAVFAVSALIALIFALNFAEAAGKFDRHGASYLYAREAFGEFVGFEVGLLGWAIRIIAWSAMAVGFATALSAIVPAVADPFYKNLVAVSVLVGLGIINYLGVNITRVFNNVLTVAKLTPLLIFILIGIFFVQAPNYSPALPAAGFTWDAFGATVLLVFYAFTGFEALAVAAGDLENPRKNIPKALIAVLILTSIIYILVQTVAVGTLGANLAKSTAPIADAATVFLGGWGKWLVTLGALISIAGINVAASFEVPRGVVALAQDGLFPRVLASQSKYNTPHLAILLTVLFAIPVAASGSFTQLAAISVISRFIQYIPTFIAVLIFRKTRPDANAFRIPFGPLVPVLAVLISAWLLTKATTVQLQWGFGALAIGVPLYFAFKLLDKSTYKNSQASQGGQTNQTIAN